MAHHSGKCDGKNDVTTDGIAVGRLNIQEKFRDNLIVETKMTKPSIQYMSDYAEARGETLRSLGEMNPHKLSDFLKEFYRYIQNKSSEIHLARADIRDEIHDYFLKNVGLDIIRDNHFKGANDSFNRSNRVVIKAGRHRHKLELTASDLIKMYTGKAMEIDQPETLQNKVFFDVNMYICNRGKDFLRAMCKNDFQISTDTSDSDGRKYVWLKYHQKFSFNKLTGGVAGDNKNLQVGERMWERPESERCPVQSFLKYITHLHPMSECFWQRPKKSVQATDYIWYENTALGNSTLSKMMQKISRDSDVKTVYTNHAIHSSHIPVIENISNHPQPQSSSTFPQKYDVTADTEDNIPVKLESKNGGESCEESKSAIGIEEAKSKVLGVVHELAVKDIRQFIDWMKTFQVEKIKEGLVVSCSHIDQKLPASSDKVVISKSSDARCSEDQMTEDISEAPLCDCSCSKRHGKMNDRHPGYPEDGPMFSGSPYGCMNQHVKFNTHFGTSTSTIDEDGMKLTIPSQDILLCSGVQDGTQFLIHRQKSTKKVFEPLQSRIFYSEEDCNIPASVIGVKIADSSGMRHTKSDSDFTKLQDKFKPVKKRSFLDIETTINSEDYDSPNKQKCCFSLTNSEHDGKFMI